MTAATKFKWSLQTFWTGMGGIHLSTEVHGDPDKAVVAADALARYPGTIVGIQRTRVTRTRDNWDVIVRKATTPEVCWWNKGGQWGGIYTSFLDHQPTTDDWEELSEGFLDDQVCVARRVIPEHGCFRVQARTVHAAHFDRLLAAGFGLGSSATIVSVSESRWGESGLANFFREGRHLGYVVLATVTDADVANNFGFTATEGWDLEFNRSYVDLTDRFS